MVALGDHLRAFSRGEETPEAEAGSIAIGKCITLITRYLSKDK